MPVGKKPPRRASWGVLFDRAGDRPIVRQGYGLPCGVVEAGLLGAGSVGLQERQPVVNCWIARGCVRRWAAAGARVQQAEQQGRCDELAEQE